MLSIFLLQEQFLDSVYCTNHVQEQTGPIQSFIAVHLYVITDSKALEHCL